jgi:hypothetical protein
MKLAGESGGLFRAYRGATFRAICVLKTACVCVYGWPARPCPTPGVDPECFRAA